MKNSIQLSTILLVIISSFFFGIQVNAQSVQLQESNIGRNRVYVSPLNLLNPFGSTAQITYGRVLKNGNELQLSYGHRLNSSGVALLLNEQSEFLWHFFAPRSKGGFRIGGEYQMNFYTRKGKKNYVGLETYYDLHKMNLWENFHKTLNYEAPVILQHKFGLNFKLGRKVKLGNRFFLDVYAGLGAKYLDLKYKDAKRIDSDTKDQISDFGRGFRFGFPINMKFAYSI